MELTIIVVRRPALAQVAVATAPLFAWLASVRQWLPVIIPWAIANTSWSSRSVIIALTAITGYSNFVR